MKLRRLTHLFTAAGLALFVLSGFVMPVANIFAQSTTEQSLTTVGETTGLGAEDPRLIVARIIRIGIGLLGVIAVVIVLYGGFTWMTAGGDEEKISRAKRILINGGIGLAIILFSLTITTFIISSLVNATGGGGGGGGGGGNGSGGGSSLGGGSTSEFVATAFVPSGAVPIRNIVARVTFTKNIDAASVGSSVVVRNSSGATVDGVVASSGNALTFRPSAACPEPNADRFCFDANTAYTIEVKSSLKSTSGTMLTCSARTPCTASFTTGDLIDTESPRAQVTLPDDGGAVSVDSLVPLQVLATDDAAVSSATFSVGSTVIDTVPASGADLKNVLLDSTWATAGVSAGDLYKITASVSDMAGNTDENSVSVRTRAASCFNGVTDSSSGETGIDCGGDPENVNYCGACGGSSCTADADCGASGFCVSGSCVALPVITKVSPPDGAVGTFVTIDGDHLGLSTGKVFFTGSTGEVAATVADCSAGWSDDEVTVQVPEGAISGPIRIQTSDQRSDATNDDRGELILDFEVNSVSRPSLCFLSPSSGTSGSAVTVGGQGFGGAQGESLVHFGDAGVAKSYAVWSDEKITSTAPTLAGGKYSVFVSVGGVESNALTYTLSENIVSLPAIAEITPSSGGVGRYVSLDGSSFGDSTGLVKVVSKATGDEAFGTLEFPAECKTADNWRDAHILFAIPKFFKNNGNVAPGDYDISLQTSSGAQSNTVPFTVIADDTSPNLCAVSPDSGTSGDTVSLFGSGFGESTGAVNFFSSKSATVSAWSDTKVTVAVPPGTASGKVSLSSALGKSANDGYFLVNAGSLSAARANAATYSWSFSTGAIPDVPKVISECSADRVSAVPNTEFTDAVCVNAVVYAEFTQDMNEATVRDAVTVEACTGTGTNPCSTATPVAGSIKTHVRSFTFLPDASLLPATMYRVTVQTGAKSLDDSPLAQAAQWTFTTSADTSPCSIEEVRVSPSSATISALNDTQGFSALPVSGCVVTDSSSYLWDWSVDESFARFTASAEPSCVGGATDCATVEALAEGTTKVTAKEAGSAISGAGDLSINFVDPYITSVWPSCTEACVNAEVGGSFNTAMDARSVEEKGAVTLYTCGNELCSGLTEVTDAVASCSSSDCRDFAFAELNLTPGKYYRVIVSGDVKSLSEVALTRPNYGGDYSWTFRAREDGTACAVNRISLSPASVTLEAVGDTSAFSADAYGEADSCSVSGERLSGFDYSWNWTDPDTGEDIADQNIDGDVSTRVAEWYGASLVDTDSASIPEGCSASCTPEGSKAYAAICGDAKIGPGEECEDGNVADGDGCSSSCLREGSSGNRCGNGTVEKTAFEDCDDGNTADGDGCSSACLAEGSRPVGATCGNNDVAASETSLAGEECDDGNAKNGDGCSSECVNEGSPTLASLGGAVCGDGETDSPAESCDDGNTADGDGCSSSCLAEGSSARYAAPSVCNDGKIGVGEECEDGNTHDGDGCSSSCILEGSSRSYAAPSFCGDGKVGTGEAAICEDGARGDGKIDPLQVAVVRSDAVFEVSADTKEARATVTVGEASSGFSTTADLTLMCAAVRDTDCKDPSTHGVGTESCCVPRPTVTLSPSTGSVVCRNASLYGVFSEEMNTSSFSYSEALSDGVTKYRMYAKLDTGAGLACPSSHTTLAQLPKNVFARLWYRIVRFVTGDIAEAATGDCVVPIDSYEQVAQDDGTYKVYLHYGALLEPGGKYTLVVEGDTAVTDETTEGVLSALGTGMNGTASTDFIAGNDVCALDEVSVTDTDSDSPNTFTRGEEAHTFVAAGLSHRGQSIEEIESVAGEYAWSITSWTSGDAKLFSATADAVSPSSATVTALGVNGQTSVVATATITEDKYGVSAGTTSVEGSADVTAFLCENPWPALSEFPWSDDAAGEASGLASYGVGWTNYSLYYCRDSGSTGDSDDYPALSVVRPSVSRSPNVIKEYLYEVGDGSGDAIGVRIVSNSDYDSVRAWYDAQGFSGSPAETSVDGFAALEDGRTTYVSAPNMTDTNSIYPNIYVISVNDGASETTQNIASQIIENISFGTNIQDVALCVESDGVTTTDTACSSDLDCSSGQTCGSVKAKVRRDLRRLTDLTDLRASFEDYGKTNGQCSVTTSKFCTTSSDCPGTESCNSIVPLLSSGTYVRGLASSVWSSWSGILGGAVENESLATDPLNVYASCGVADSTYAAYDAQTCVDQTRGVYACPSDSHTYHYRTNGALSASLYADLEYNGVDWVSAIDDPADDHSVNIVVGDSSGYADGFTTASFCDGSSYGSSSACGDGIVGSTETCERGQAGGAASACTTDAGAAGTKSQICNSTCNGYIDNPAASCLTTSCGDGVINSGEICDDGSLNGTYGYCGATCTYDSAFYCGDGELAGGEACDCGSSVTASTSSSRAYGADPGTCSGVNGTYATSPNASCSWDCKAPASYCGDGKVDSGEQCDGTDDTWDGELCSKGKIGQKCTVDADCGKVGGTCGPAGTLGLGPNAACAVGQTRTRACDDAAGGTCKYAPSWSTCAPIGSCGDGTVDADEACDDGNTDSSDACTSSCTVNVCGDGAIYDGVEECDQGAKNGGSCSSSYGSSCTACSVSCRNVVTSGEFCGDGKKNGAEYCDASAIPLTYYDSVTDTTFGNCTTESATITDSSGVIYTCRDLGICNGGAKNGDYCTGSSLSKSKTDEAVCGTGSSCVKPTCNDTCTASCPFTYSKPSLLLTSNQPGARAAGSVLLNSYSSSTTSTLPNAATITVPACTAVGAFTGDIGLDSVDFPDVYVTFLIDRSGSMGDALGSKTRMEVAHDVVSDAVSTLYKELGSRMHIGLVGFSDYAGTGLASNPKVSSCTEDIKSGSTTYTCTQTSPMDGFMDEADEDDLLARITDYTIDHGTQTATGLKSAKKLLDDKATIDTNVRKIVILLSDGAPSGGTTGVKSATTAAEDLKDAGYEVYTVALTTTTSLKGYMKEWSSNSKSATSSTETSYAYNSDNGIDYAYDGSTAAELADVYGSIVDSIVGVTLSFVSTSGSTTSLSTATLVEGTDLPLPWPTGFKCDGVTEQKLPVQITFGGEGQIELSNVKYSYCAP